MIDQRFCKYIKTIAQYHSFSKAAQVLYVSQPALSRFVKKVEDELGVTLFDRDTIPLRLTLAGQRYLEYVEQFQGLERNMRQEFSAMGKQSFNRLTIATLPLLGIYVLPRIVPDFAEQFPSVDQKIVECSSAEILKQLDHDDVDLVLTNLRPDNPHLRYERLMGDPVVLATQYDEQMQQYYPDCGNNLEHPLQVDLSQFEQQTLIVLRAWQNMRIVAETICRHYSFCPSAGGGGTKSVLGAQFGRLWTGNDLHLPLLCSLYPAPNSLDLLLPSGSRYPYGYSGSIPP